MRLETYKMATSILLKFQTLKCDISRTIWRIEVSDGSLFCIFHALSFERNLFFDRTCPLRQRRFVMYPVPTVGSVAIATTVIYQQLPSSFLVQGFLEIMEISG